jgi:hypothetical protein
MPTVWVTQETDHDIRQAERWGDIKYVSGRDFLSIQDSEMNEGILSKIRRCTLEFDPNKDWILITGSPYLAVMFVGSIVAICGPTLNMSMEAPLRFLRWSNRDGQYYPITFPYPR